MSIKSEISNLKKACDQYENALIQRFPLHSYRAKRALAAGNLLTILPFCKKHLWTNSEYNPNYSSNYAYRELIQIAEK